MNSSSYDIIMDMFSSLQTERDELQALINQNNAKIEELDNFIQSFLDKEDSNYKMFSPRSAESVYKNELNHSKEEIALLNKQNKEYFRQMDILYDKMEQLDIVLQNEKGNISGSVIDNTNIAILNIQEEDRCRIARDLHDTSLQNLAYLIHKIELASKYIDQDSLRAKLELSVISKNIRDVIEEIRGVIFDLRPMTFDDLGLKAAFERLITVTNESKNYVIDLDIEDVSCENNLVLVTIYRVVQECLSNIVKHAEADRIRFHAKLEKYFYHIIIEDNGKGFDEEEILAKKDRHFGMSVLKERIRLLGGTIDIKSVKDKGTRINIDIPIKYNFEKLGEKKRG